MNGLRPALREAPLLLLVIVIVGMMVIPLPTPLLDVLLTFNLSFALLVLMVTMSTRRALEFSSFPSLLLLTTLLRLALNVSSSRLILLQGFAGEVIQGFGSFVVGGNPVVGFIIFLILVVIQYVVVTRGAERVAEVAARFTLDAMPGKQMAIDADLNSGLIDEATARSRRQQIQAEADFYGAMDGASKYVRGDAVAGLVIIAINIIGGFVVGIVQRHLSFSQAVSTYTLLTVGDGLVTQIPALLLSTATGIMVTRAASDTTLGTEVISQILHTPRLLWVAAAALGVFGLMPGLPLWAFWGLGGMFAYMAYTGSHRTLPPPAPAPAAAPRPENVASLLPVDPLEVELGYGLIPLGEAQQGGDLLDRVVMIRRQTALEMGLVLQPIRLRDNLVLGASTYSIKLRGIQVATGELRLGSYLAMDPTGKAPPLQAVATREPVFGLPAYWVSADERAAAEIKGYTVVDPPSIIATHLQEVVRQYAPDLLGRQDTAMLIEGVKKEHPTVVDELIPQLLTIGEVEQVLKNLLRERVSIRDLVLILEALGDGARRTRDIDELTEIVRQRLARAISHTFGLDDAPAPVVTLGPAVESVIAEGILAVDGTRQLQLEASLAGRIVDAIARESQKVIARGREPVLLCSASVRTAVRRLTERTLPRLVVLAYPEVEPEFEVEAVGVVEMSTTPP